MWSKIYMIFSLLTGTLAQIPFPLSRSLSDGVKSAGYKVIYADEDMMTVNEVSDKYEDALKKDPKLYDILPPLPSEDVKCLMSVDRHCSKNMRKIKAVIIKAIVNNCKQCTIPEKEKAGQVIATMMAHDRTAWKLFLTRLALVAKSKKARKEDTFKLKVVGIPEDVPRSKETYIFTGAKVRVKRYVAKKL